MSDGSSTTPTTIRLRDEVLDQIDERSEAAGLTRSKWIRGVLTDAVNADTRATTDATTRDYSAIDELPTKEDAERLRERIDELEDEVEMLRATVEGIETARASDREHEQARDTAADEGREGPATDEAGERPDQRPKPRDLDAEDPVADALEGWRPGSHSRERREIKADGRAALEFVRAREQPVGRSDIVDALEDRIDNAGISADGWWRRRARPALKHAPPVEMRGRRWVWVGDQTKREGDR